MISLIKKQKRNLDNNNGDNNFFSVISGRRIVSMLCFVALLEVMSPLMMRSSGGIKKAVVYVSDDKEAINTDHSHRHHNKTVSFARNFEKHMKQCSIPRDMAKTKEIVIYGERHHGTNFARSVIVENALPSILCERDHHHGWKHGLVPPKANLKKNEILLVITRDVFSWLPKMHKETYCQNQGGKLPFSDFIRSGYACRPHRGKNLTETAANIVRIRTRKYKNWLTRNPDYFNFGAKPKFCTRVHLRYESIIEDGQENTIGKILKGYGIDKKGDFKPIKKRAGPTGAVGKKYEEADFKRESIEVLSQYSLKDVQFVLENLDLEFETNVLNYNYDYVLEHIEQETAKMRDNLSARGKSN